MHPVLFTIAGHELPTYALFIALGFLAAWPIRRAEVARIGQARVPGYAWVSAGALLGAVVGSKLGMLLFDPWPGFVALLRAMLAGDFTGKTVVGGLAGGYLGVEIAKKIVGIRDSTGDGFAVALPVAQAIGRVGCFMNGCCYGSPWSGPWAVSMAGTTRHPTQIYEAILDLGLAAALWSIRLRPRPAGHLFRRYLIGYSAIRFALEPLRGDTGWTIGPFTAVQVACLLTILGFGSLLWIRERPLRAAG